jgi:hypothetical protein
MNEEISKAAAAFGQMGGAVTSESKAAAARENGKKGGRPLKFFKTYNGVFQNLGNGNVLCLTAHRIGLENGVRAGNIYNGGHHSVGRKKIGRADLNEQAKRHVREA